MATNPVKDIVNHLALVVGELTLGTNLHGMREVEPDGGVLARSVFVWAGISAPPSTFLNGAPADINEYSLEIVVRGNQGGLEDASDLADVVRDALRHAKPLIAGGPEVYTTVDLDGQPFRLEEDKNNRPRFKLNVAATAFEPNA